MMLARHDLVWLSREGWQAARRAAQPAQLAVIDRWSGSGWPATVRRQDADALPDQACLGITLPHDGEGESAARIRVGLRCLRTDIAKTARPLALGAASEAVPAQWKTAYRKLITSAAGFDIRVYGSLALQALTGRPYLTGRSDIDLAFFPAGLTDLAEGSRLFEAAFATLPLDGEVVFPSGRAVAWKEWCKAAEQGARARVLVKDMRKVGLIWTDELLNEFTEPACTR